MKYFWKVVLLIPYMWAITCMAMYVWCVGHDIKMHKDDKEVMSSIYDFFQWCVKKMEIEK